MIGSKNWSYYQYQVTCSRLTLILAVSSKIDIKIPTQKMARFAKKCSDHNTTNHGDFSIQRHHSDPTSKSTQWIVHRVEPQHALVVLTLWYPLVHNWSNQWIKIMRSTYLQCSSVTSQSSFGSLSFHIMTNLSTCQPYSVGQLRRSMCC